MAATNTKGTKRRLDDDDDDSRTFNPATGEIEDEEMSSDVEEGEEQLVDFDFCDPAEDAWHAVKRSLAHYLNDVSDFDANGMADLITEQAGVGTILKVNEQPVGYISLLDMHQDAFCMTQVKSFILDRCSEPGMVPVLQQLFDDKSSPLGLLLNWRVPNVPGDVAPVLHRTVYEEAYSVAGEEPEFGFQNYVLICTGYVELSEASTENVDEPTGKRKKADEGELKFFNEEDVLYKNAARLGFTFPLKFDNETKITLGPTLKVMGVVVVVSADAIAGVLDELNTFEF